MKLKRTQIIEIDLERERNRLKECFKGAKLKRHLKLVDLFEQGKIEEFFEKYDNLPRDKKGEYPEQENVGDYWKWAIEEVKFSSPWSCVTTHQTVTERID